MRPIHHFLIAAGLLLLLPGIIAAQRSQPVASPDKAPLLTPGPENGGLRMQMVITPNLRPPATRMDIEISNVSDRPVTLRADWQNDEEKGDLKDYLEAAIGIETLPAIEPWSGQVMVGGRTAPQPEATLKPGESLALSWQTDGKRLKTRVADLLKVQNPEFAVPGLYSVHAVLALSANGETVLLRSNEQLFPAGGSYALPRSTWGEVTDVTDKDGTALLRLGWLQKVQKGDQFRIRTGYSEFYRISILRTEPSWSVGTLFPEPLDPESSRAVPFPKTGQWAALADVKLPVPNITTAPPKPSAPR
jgi:hypothetical protein